MIRSLTAAPLALALLVALGDSSAHGQAPTAELSKPQPSDIPPVSAATPVAAQPPAIPDLGPGPPDLPVELVPLVRPWLELWPGEPGQDPDAGSGRGGGFSPFMNTLVGRAPFRADYRLTWFSSEPVGGQNANLGYVQQALSFSFPIWQNGTCDEWSASATVRNELYQTNAILPDTRQAFPEELWNVHVGTTYRHLFDNGWIAGGTVSVGSASDKPFRTINEMTVGVNTFLRVPSGEHNAWLFSLSYSPTGQLPFPIPGVAYVWQPSESFRVNIGLPFQIMWRPIDDLTLDVSYMLLTTLRARATYRICQPVRVYIAYGSDSEAFLLADRADTNQRFFNVDQRVTTGVQVHINHHASFDLSGGYVFDHYYFEGNNITSGTNFNRVGVGNGAFVSGQLQFKW